MFVSHAQNFEDVILWRALGHVTDGTYVDVGAADPVVDSVSLAFYERGWRGVHVEPSPSHAAAIRTARPDEDVIEALIGPSGLCEFFEFPDTGLSTGVEAFAARHVDGGYDRVRRTLPSVPLSHLLSRFGDEEVHWLKIDVEGMEQAVIESWSPSPVRPWVLVVEATEPGSPHQNHEGWDPLVLELGYRFVYFDGLNRFYLSQAHEELADRFGAGPNVFDGFQLTRRSPFVAHAVAEADASAREQRARAQALAEDKRTLEMALERSQDDLRRAQDDLSRLSLVHDRLQRDSRRLTPPVLRRTAHGLRDGARSLRRRGGGTPRGLRRAAHSLRDALRSVRGRLRGSSGRPGVSSASSADDAGSPIAPSGTPWPPAGKSLEWTQDAPRRAPQSLVGLQAPSLDALMVAAVERTLQRALGRGPRDP